MAVWILLLLFYVNINLCLGNNSAPYVNCTVHLNVLADAVSSFTSCAISHSRPIKFCEKCVDQYIKVLNSYENLTVLHDEDGPCINNYINLDRLEITETLYRNSQDLWNRAKCYECFQIVDGKVINNISIETITFNKLFTNLTECINRTDVNQTTLCSICMDTYNKLNNYYISISNENEKIGVCMDIVDVMNGTRAYWSTNCCKFRRKNEQIFIVSAATVIISTLLFYILTKVWSEKKPPIILKQSRFAGSFNQAIN